MTKKIKWQTIKPMALLMSLLFSVSLLAEDSFVPDHYLTYDIETSQFASEKVVLSDQFINDAKFTVGRPVKLLNPALKRHNNQVFPIQNEKLHYTAYGIKPVDDIKINKNVLVFNQFGMFNLNKFRPTLLLTPTIKREVLALTAEEAQELKADHYLCYDILEQEVSGQFGYLKDQFGGRKFEKLVAKRLCNPVAKVHNDQKYEIRNDTIFNHLMCFDIEQDFILRLVTLRDQFGKKLALVYQDDQVCVPSVKVEIPENPCSLDDAGECGGECDDGMVCGIDAANMCSCVLEVKECGMNADGQCGGACAEGLICDQQDEKCQCLPPVLECGFNADGICGGDCLDGQICTQKENECFCAFPEPSCGFVDEGVCGGPCPTGFLCKLDQISDTCTCVEIPSCGMNADGQCGGACPERLNCELDSLTDECLCKEPTPECGYDAEGQCGGRCDQGFACIEDVISKECFCQKDFGCGLTDDGTCGGSCPDAYRCVDLGDTCQCQ